VFRAEKGEEKTGRHNTWIFTRPGSRATGHHRSETTIPVVMLPGCLLGNPPPRAKISPETAAALNYYCWCYLPFKMVLDASPGTQRIKHA